MTQTENYQKQREEALQSAQQRESAFRPIRSEIIRLYYADPAKIKAQLDEIFQKAGENTTQVQISVVARLRALVVKAIDEDINFVNKYIEQVDVATKQVLIEAFIVEATNKFEEELGTRFGMTLGGRGANDFLDTTVTGLAGGVAAAGVAVSYTHLTLPTKA